MLRRFTKKRTIVALSVVAALVVAGAAFAYFTSTGSGTGHATVGTAGTWTVGVAAPTGGPIYPGAGSENLGYTVTNSGSGNQNLATTSASVAHDGSGNILDHGTAVPGCLAADFTAQNNPPSYGVVAGGQAVSGSVDVTMQDSGVSQNACQSASPDITVSAG